MDKSFMFTDKIWNIYNSFDNERDATIFLKGTI